MIAPRQTGLLLDEATGDLMLHNNRIVIGNSLYQNQYLLLKMRLGSCKGDPVRGVGIDDMLGDEGNALFWKKRIREQFSRDRLKVSDLKITDNGIEKLEAYYE